MVKELPADNSAVLQAHGELGHDEPVSDMAIRSIELRLLFRKLTYIVLAQTMILH